MLELSNIYQLFIHSSLCVSFGKLFLSTLIGTLVGYERESHDQAAGLRTNILVCLSACLLMQLSLSAGNVQGPDSRLSNQDRSRTNRFLYCCRHGISGRRGHYQQIPFVPKLRSVKYFKSIPLDFDQMIH